jgi:hypothetical protein
MAPGALQAKEVTFLKLLLNEEKSSVYCIKFSHGNTVKPQKQKRKTYSPQTKSQPAECWPKDQPVYTAILSK